MKKLFVAAQFTEEGDNMYDKPMWLYEFGIILDESRRILTSLEVVEEESLRYAIIRLFARATLSMCEIYTLMDNGYPEGAYVLSRQLYETMVIMNHLIQNRTDINLLKRYFDDVAISCLNIHIQRADYCNDSKKSKYEEKLNEFKKIYSSFLDKKRRFSDYWWVNKGCNFTELSNNTQFPKNYMYSEISKIVHVSAFSSIIYTGKNQEGILIGSTYDGVEKAGWYSLLCYAVIIDMFKDVVSMQFESLIARIKTLIEKMNKKL